MADYAKVHGWVSGHVQGVFFRYFTQETANRYGLTGWVRNLPDGRVEFIAEGVKGLLDDFLKDINRGPAGSSVSGVEVVWDKFSGEFKDFKIGY